MGTPVPAARNTIFIEGSTFRSAISEDLLQRFGASINFINQYVYNRLEFGAGGIYGNYTGGFPLLGVGTNEQFNDNSSIVNVVVFSTTTGTSGTTELDIKWAPLGSGVYTSIFSTTPKITSAAANNVVFDANGINSTPAGCTAPVLSKVSFNQGDQLRFDMLQAMPNGADVCVIVFYRAR